VYGDGTGLTADYALSLISTVQYIGREFAVECMGRKLIAEIGFRYLRAYRAVLIEAWPFSIQRRDWFDCGIRLFSNLHGSVHRAASFHGSVHWVRSLPLTPD